jgi:hypothetical protein
MTLGLAILLVVGACSAGGSPVVPDNNSNTDNYAGTVEGIVYHGASSVDSGYVFVFDLATFEKSNEAEIGTDGKYKVGVNEGQYLVFPVTPGGWRVPSIGDDFSSYINVETDQEYRMDIELNRILPDGNELVFGFVLSSQNDQPVTSATVSAGGSTTTTDAYGFYAMSVPSGTSVFTITAEGFFDLVENTRDTQGTHDYFDTPFFMLNPINQTGASIGGVVRDVSSGAGLGGARITLMRPEDPNWVDVQYLTNLGGKYRFYNLPEGIYKMLFERPGYVSSIREGLVVSANDEVIINVFLSQDASNRASIWGYVNNASIPLPISGARVTASNPLLGSKMTTSVSTGYYRIDGLVPGDYTIIVSAPGTGVTFYEALSSYQTLESGDNRVDFSMRFVNEGALRGLVIIEGAGGAFPFPPTGVEVTAEMIGGPISGVKFKTTSDGKGVYIFNGLPSGFYLVKGTAEYAPNTTYSGMLEDVYVNAGTTTVADLTLFLE